MSRCIALVIILHIARRADWARAKEEGFYPPAALEGRDLIPCAGPAQLTSTANSLFKGKRDLILLCIIVGELCSPVKWEPSTIAGEFPFICGKVNLGAVALAVDLVPDADGRFELPREVATFKE